MKIAKKLLLFALVGCYAVVFAEFFVRVFATEPLMPRYVTAAGYGVRTNMPGAVYWHTTPETQVQMRINAQGMRSDREYGYAKPAGTCRIVLLGDSFFVGYEVKLEDSFSYLLRQLLKDRGYRCQIINLAVSGFGTAEMIIALREEGVKYRPDIVVMEWHRTDPSDNRRSGLFDVVDGRLVQARDKYLPAVEVRDRLMEFSVYRWLIENSQLYSAVRRTAARKVKRLLLEIRRTERRSGRANTPGKERKPPTGGLRHEASLDLALLKKAEVISNSAGAPLLLVDVPVRQSRTDYESAFKLLPSGFADNLEAITPLAAFEAAASADTKLYYEEGAGHWSPLGNRIFARVVASYIMSKEWLVPHPFRCDG